MTQNILIINRKKVDSLVNEMIREVHARGVESIFAATVLESVFLLTSEKKSLYFPSIDYYLSENDLIYFRTVNTEFISSICQLFPNLAQVQKLQGTNFRSKLIQFCAFAREHLSIPNSVFLNNTNALNPVLTNLKFPIVIKDVAGTRGINVFIAQDEEELRKIINDNPQTSFLFQEYIPNDYDMRVEVYDGKIGYACQRIRQTSGEWRNNCSLGGKYINIIPEELRQDVKELAIKAAASLNLSFAGIDILINKENNKPYLLELNYIPAFEIGLSEIPSMADMIVNQFHALNQGEL